MKKDWTDAFNADVFSAVEPVGILLSFVHCEDPLCFSVNRLVSDTKHLTVISLNTVCFITLDKDVNENIRFGNPQICEIRRPTCC